MNILIMALLGAILWRVRGGILNALTGKANWLGIFNDTTVRGIWSIGMADAFWFLHPLPYWRAGLLVAALSAGTTVIGWFGAALYPAKWRDIALLSLSGTLRMAFVAVVLLSPWPLLAGVLFGPAYWMGARIPQKLSGWDFWGEFITGAVIGACLGLA